MYEPQNLHTEYDRDSTVIFGGRVLTESVPGARVLDIEIGAASIEARTEARILRSGETFRRKRHGRRNIVVTVELPLKQDGHAKRARMLRDWAESQEPMALRLPAYIGETEIFALLTSDGGFSLRDWWLPIELTFTAYDPCFISQRWKSADTSSAFFISGNEAPSAKLSLQVATQIENPSWLIDNEKRIALNGSFGSGEILIDFDTLTVYHDGNRIMDKLAPTSRFPSFAPGNHTITGAGGQIMWKERWL